MSNEPGEQELPPPNLHKKPGDGLRQDVAALSTSILATQGAVKQLTKLLEDKYAPREEITKDRRRAILTVVVAVVLAVVLTMLINNREITQCFLSGASKHNTICNTLFPGYNASVDRQNERLKQFTDLLADRETRSRENAQFIEENKQRLADLERDIEERAKLREAQIRDLQQRVERLEARFGR